MEHRPARLRLAHEVLRLGRRFVRFAARCTRLFLELSLNCHGRRWAHRLPSSPTCNAIQTLGKYTFTSILFTWVYSRCQRNSCRIAAVGKPCRTYAKHIASRKVLLLLVLLLLLLLMPNRQLTQSTTAQKHRLRDSNCVADSATTRPTTGCE